MIKPRPLVSAPEEITYKGGWTMPPPEAGIPHARQLRDKVASRYDEAISYAMPGRDGITAGPDQSEIYDDTAVIATPEFASRIQEGVIPNFSRWGSYIAGILVEDPDQKDQLMKALEQIDIYLFEMINSSNFSVEANECFLDLALGTFCLRIDEGAFDNPFNARAIPLRSLSFCIGPDGRPDPIYEERELTVNSIHVHYPEAVIPKDMFEGDDPYCKIKVVEAWHRDWSQPSQVRYRQSVIVPGKENRAILTEWHQGPGSCPNIIGRWSKASGEGWGRGPLFNILPSVRKVNFAERKLMDHAELAIAGIWTMEDDGIINTSTVKIEPGTLVPTALGSKGLQNVTPGANFDIAGFLLTEARGNIKKALYTEQLGNPNKTPMSAAEVNQRMAELARAVGAPFARLIIEFAMPVIMRCTRILVDKGLIQMPRVDNKRIKLVSTSPLAQAQRFEVIDSLQGYGTTMNQVFGPQATNVFIDGSKFAEELGDAMRVPRSVRRPPAQQKQLLDALTKMAQQGQTPPGGGTEQQAA